MNKYIAITAALVAAPFALQAFAADKEAAAKKTVVEIAAGNKDFSTLVTAVKAAGLAETLSGEGPFTVFAPTNEAFAKLPKGTVEDLLKPENKTKLAGILTYHVVSGKVLAADVVEDDVGDFRLARGADQALHRLRQIFVAGPDENVAAHMEAARLEPAQTGERLLAREIAVPLAEPHGPL